MIWASGAVVIVWVISLGLRAPRKATLLVASIAAPRYSESALGIQVGPTVALPAIASYSPKPSKPSNLFSSLFSLSSSYLFFSHSGISRQTSSWCLHPPSSDTKPATVTRIPPSSLPRKEETDSDLFNLFLLLNLLNLLIYLVETELAEPVPWPLLVMLSQLAGDLWSTHFANKKHIDMLHMLHTTNIWGAWHIIPLS